MAALLLDSNIVSYLQKNDTRAQLDLPHLAKQQLTVAFMTVAELYQWAIAKKWGPTRVAELKAFLHTMVTLPYDDELGWHWAKVRSISGFPVASNDAWIAATSIRYGYPLVTHNRSPFAPSPA